MIALCVIVTIAILVLIYFLLIRKQKFKHVDDRTIDVNGVTRTHYVSGEEYTSQPILLAFHGGGESVYNTSGIGFLKFTKLYNLGATVIGFQGQKSKNEHSWISAFPWMYSPPEDDVLFMDKMLQTFTADNRKIYTTGKSDGAGFAIYLPTHLLLCHL